MNKLALVGATLLGALLVAPSAAQAQCGYPYGYCGVVYVAPQPVYVAPAPAPTVVVAQPAPVAVEAAPSPYVRAAGFGVGLRASAGYAGENGLGLYGGGLVLRYIATPHIGLELDVDGYGAGTDGDDAYLVPFSLSGLVFLNARSHFQPYLLAGINATVLGGRCFGDDTFLYAGGHVGLGIEVLLGRHVGLTLDGRTFVQGMVHGDDSVEYGVTFNTGLNVYL